ncbi:response regulator [uncultured Paraglaciecola sp.]|uniref:response regulator transcription factor n=1 Tax=uncultured Paraglaciecola sp. TaxID=1765024 RepID=UPI002608DE23|nr:response regulator [uncultured Paraglaciecola sp.]
MVCQIKVVDKPIVYIVDSDPKLRRSLSEQLSVHNVLVEVFDSAETFLTSKLKNRAACLIVEENLPCMNGIALLEHINSLGFRLPTFVLSSDCDLSKAVRAMQAQAIDFIEKPFIEKTLISEVMNVLPKQS